MKTYEELVTDFTEYPYSDITLGEFKKIVENYPENIIPFSIENYGSWRGIYAHPYIRPSVADSTKEALIEDLDNLLSGIFEGWKGGFYTYNEDSLLHFDYGPSYSTCTEEGSCFLNFIKENKDNRFVKFLLANL